MNDAPIYINPDGTICQGGDACTGDCRQARGPELARIEADEAAAR